MSDEIETTEEAEVPHLLDETSDAPVAQSRREADPFSDPAESGEQPIEPYDSTLGNVASDVTDVVDKVKNHVVDVVDKIEHEVESVVDKIEGDL